ncbi:MAG: ROK family transcriptional regulator [Bacillota bacterium]
MKPKKLASNSRDLGLMNRLLVRDMIRKQGPIARYEIAKAAGLTPPTVTSIVNDMIAAGVVREVGRGQSTGGRRPVMLELNPRAGFVFAVRIQRGETVAALLDLASNVLETRRVELNTSSAEDVADAIGEAFSSLLTATGVPQDQVLWCAVASPGLVDSYRGVVERSSNLVWEKVPFGAMLSGRLSGIPVHVENISNAAALGEKVYGSGQGCPNLIYLNLSVGIGAGIIIENEVYSGARGYAGEIGHMAVLPEGGPKCTCGRYGCFEAMCGIRAVLERVRSEVPDEVFHRLGIAKHRISIDDAARAPLAEIPEVQRILLDTGRLIGIAIANLMSLFNSEMVILGGELGRAAGDAFLNVVAQAARERALWEIVEHVRIVKSTMREDPALMGAYALGIEKVFAQAEWGARHTG